MLSSPYISHSGFTFIKLVIFDINKLVLMDCVCVNTHKCLYKDNIYIYKYISVYKIYKSVYHWETQECDNENTLPLSWVHNDYILSSYGLKIKFLHANI